MESCLNIVGRRRRRSRFKEWKFLLSLIIFFFFFFLCFCATYISCYNPHILSESVCLWTKEADGDGTLYMNLRNKAKANNEIAVRIGGVRKLQGGEGSSPPRCTSKCDGCTPCTPVHVPVPSRMPVTTEYYPETWRCKCGIRFYMP